MKTNPRSKVSVSIGLSSLMWCEDVQLRASLVGFPSLADQSTSPRYVRAVGA